MKARFKSSCPTDASLREFLSSEIEIDASLDHRTEQHLTACQDCQQRLEALSASEAVWSEARKVLGTHDGDDNRNKIQLNYLLSLLGPTDDPSMLGRIDAYEVAGVIGNGGTGIVFKAFDRKLNRFVAIKVLEPSFANNGSARKRFEREGKAVASVSHEHVVAVHAVDEFQGLPYIVMQYVSGKSLQQRIDQQGPLETKEITRIARQVAEALDCAHEQGIVHRDVKPANILLENGVERVRVGDFGLAQVVDDVSLTRSGFIAGTPQYMSPEQTRGETVDGRSDLFSLGSVMYAMCTGHPPFRAESSLGVLHRIANSRLRSVRQLNPEIPVWLEEFIERLLAKSPSDRFENAELVSRFLSEELAHLQHASSDPPSRPWLPLRKEPKSYSNSKLLGFVGFGVVAAMAIVFSWNGYHRGKEATPPGASNVSPSASGHSPQTEDSSLATDDSFAVSQNAGEISDPSKQHEGTAMISSTSDVLPSDDLDEAFQQLIQRGQLLEQDIELYLTSGFPIDPETIR